MTFEEWLEKQPDGYYSSSEVFNAGAASRDAEIAELVEALEWSLSLAEGHDEFGAIADDESNAEAAKKLIAKVRKPIRCPLCNYQYGHSIGCKNNPVDQALADTEPKE